MVLIGGKSVKEVTIYTDGACSGNPGPGGYGAMLFTASMSRSLAVENEQRQITGWKLWLSSKH